MIETKTEQVIQRPAADIWAYAADIVRHPDWMNVTDAALVRGSGSDVGSRGRERLGLARGHSPTTRNSSALKPSDSRIGPSPAIRIRSCRCVEI